MSKIARVITGYFLVAVAAVLTFITRVLWWMTMGISRAGLWVEEKADEFFPRQTQFIRKVADDTFPSSTEYLRDVKEEDEQR